MGGDASGDGDAWLFHAVGVTVSPQYPTAMILCLSWSPGLQAVRVGMGRLAESTARTKLTLEPQRGGRENSGLQLTGV